MLLFIYLMLSTIISSYGFKSLNYIKRNNVALKSPSSINNYFFIKRKQFSATNLFCDPNSIDADLMIKLTTEEKELFDFLRNIVENEKLNTTLRVAGGWVRDKILESSSSSSQIPISSSSRTNMDIDIAIDNMSGEEFIDAVNFNGKKHGRGQIKVGIIQKNPSKSKHLATATARLGPFDVDFVNLRTETYVDNSRIPKIEIGTPFEDAMRRDLTINSLFYNINNSCIEDFTARGLNDLKNGVINTPLEPLITLQDDPLRALRIVRFASRFRFNIQQNLYNACSNETVLHALQVKVSRERVSQEVEKMLNHINGYDAINTLYQTNLLKSVFLCNDGGNKGISGSDKTAMVHSNLKRGIRMTFLSEKYFIPRMEEENYHDINSLTSGESAKVFRYATLLASSRHLNDISNKDNPNDNNNNSNPKIKAKRPVLLMEDILSKSLRLRNKTVNEVIKLHKMMDEFIVFLQLLNEYNAKYLGNNYNISIYNSNVKIHDKEGPMYGPISRLKLGRLLRSCGPIYKQAIILAVSEVYLQLAQEDIDLEDPEIDVNESVADKVYYSMMQLLEAVDKLELNQVWNMTPHYHGKHLKELFPMMKDGPTFGVVINEQIDWMLSNPNGDIEVLKAHLKNIIDTL